MKSMTLPTFWEKYYLLDTTIKQQAKKVYGLWLQNPFHPSLHFKCINTEEDIWSVRITRSYRALGVLEAGTVTWFWIGSHDDYERFFG
ncbi:conserved hypothetical protein [Kamptonema sp. PCC 6506]|nr:conserved hypothetical protein [Kamptonema sp. PCC 6506]